MEYLHPTKKEKGFKLLCILLLSLSLFKSEGQSNQDFNNLPLYFPVDSLPEQDSGNLDFISITETEYNRERSYSTPFKQNIENKYQGNKEGFVLRTEKSTFHFWNDTTDAYSSIFQYVGFLRLLNCHIINHCAEGSCSDYLLEYTTDQKFLLPCSYDGGVQSLSFSPSGRLFFVSSSYDGPDYDSFYNYRSEIYVFQIPDKGNLENLRLIDFSLLTQWSIEEVHWLDENVLGLKVYTGNRPPSESADEQEGYSYLKAHCSN